MDVQYSILVTELGIIALTGIITVILLLIILSAVKKFSQVQPMQRIQPQLQGIPMQQAQMAGRPMQPLQETTVLNAGMPQTKPETTINQQPANSRYNGESGLVFCRNCGQSFSSNETACPSCKTLR